MTTEQDYRVAIGAYVLGGLQPEEAAELEGHLDDCPDCQRELAELTDTAAQLALVPPELVAETLAEGLTAPFPAGPAPRGGTDDLILQRTLRDIRAERVAARRRRTLAVAAGLVALVAAPVITAVALGGGTGGTPVAQPPASTAPAGTVIQASDSATGVSGVATLVSAPWGTKLQARFTGEPKGETCRLFVVSSSGEREIAANWIVTAVAANGAGTNVQGSVSIPKTGIDYLRVQTATGRTLLTIDA
jgi:anti-sigma factor RsiW